jgi:serine/threonine protein kinase
MRQSRTYSFVLDEAGRPIEIGSGRFARVFLGEERWVESATDLKRPVAIKMLAKGVGAHDAGRFRMEKQLLERVQGHPSIVELFGSGFSSDPGLPALIREQCDGDFMILEKLDMNLEERIKGSRNAAAREDLLGFDMHDRLLRVLEYMIPIASAVEYAHLACNVCHRDIKPANVLVGLRDRRLAGSKVRVRLADFNVAKMHVPDGTSQMGATRFSHAVPGTLYFESPEQEMNIVDLLVNVEQGSAEIEYFEDFYVDVGKSDTFALFNRSEEYIVLHNDRAKKRLVLTTPYSHPSETNIRARVQKSVGRPADIYSLGALFYYLITGAFGNPKSLYDTLRKFVEYERADESNTVEAYLRHEYETLNAIRSPKTPGTTELAPADRFFSYKHYLDGNGELIDVAVMTLIARCMVRNKPDSYCQSHDLDTTGIFRMVTDLTNLYSLFGFQAGTIPAHLPLRARGQRAGLGARGGGTGPVRKLYDDVLSLFGVRKKP